MNLGLDDDRRALRDAARSVLAAECPPAVTREAYDDPTRWRALWKTVTDLGWTAAGGPDSELIDLVVLMEQAGAATLPAPLLSTAGLAAGAMRACGDAGATVLEELAGGSVGALAVDAVDPGSDRGLRISGDRISGRVATVRDAERADSFVAVAVDEAGNNCVAVVRPGAGVVITPGTSVDPSVPVASVEFDTTVEGQVIAPTRRVLAVPLVAAAAELVGVADRALAMAVDYAKTRQQFGQPIGAFQAVKHRLADCYVGVERARSLTYLAATLAEPSGPDDADAWRTVMLAKAAAGDAATAATRANVAVHGAIAQTWEHNAHLLLRRAWVGSSLLGESGSLYIAAGRDYAAVSA